MVAIAGALLIGRQRGAARKFIHFAIFVACARLWTVLETRAGYIYSLIRVVFERAAAVLAQVQARAGRTKIANG